MAACSDSRRESSILRISVENPSERRRAQQRKPVAGSRRRDLFSEASIAAQKNHTTSLSAQYEIIGGP